MKGKKFVTLLFAVLTVSLMSVTAFCTDYSTTGTGSCLVTATLDSSYTVRIPATVSLSQDTGKHFIGTYKVEVKGDLSSSEVLEVQPAASFSMSNAGASKTATASVAQTVTKFANTASGSNQIKLNSSTFVDATGSIEVDLPSPDSYSGTLIFTISLN